MSNPNSLVVRGFWERFPGYMAQVGDCQPGPVEEIMTAEQALDGVDYVIGPPPLHSTYVTADPPLAIVTPTGLRLGVTYLAGNSFEALVRTAEPVKIPIPGEGDAMSSELTVCAFNPENETYALGDSDMILQDGGAVVIAELAKPATTSLMGQDVQIPAGALIMIATARGQGNRFVAGVDCGENNHDRRMQIVLGGEKTSVINWWLQPPQTHSDQPMDQAYTVRLAGSTEFTLGGQKVMLRGGKWYNMSMIIDQNRRIREGVLDRDLVLKIGGKSYILYTGTSAKFDEDERIIEGATYTADEDDSYLIRAMKVLVDYSGSPTVRVIEKRTKSIQ